MNMALAVFNTTLNPPTCLFSRTYIPISVPKDYFEESLRCSHVRVKLLEKSKRRCVKASIAVAPAATTDTRDVPTESGNKKLKILVAGGGIGGLVFALAAKKKGFDVKVFERDMSAIRGEGQYRGPIQLQSNALEKLEAIDLQVAEAIMNAGCVTGDRINGLVDGLSGSWYVKFDTLTPAVKRGLPITRVISRLTLQQILADALGEDIIINGSNVVDFKDGGDKITVLLENGQRYEGELLVGADGIRSKVRKNLFGPSEPSYSGYTCYSGLVDFIPPDIDTVGYRVFLGNKQYFVSSDIGDGKMQWYAFHHEAPGGADPPNGQKKRLLDIFGGWCDHVVDLLQATNENAILRRDIYDHLPIFTWGKGRVTLLGDSAHAMQPNLGQGGCMAIEDGYQLALELEKACTKSTTSGAPIDITSSIQRYVRERRLRVILIYGMSKMAAIMATSYRPYLGSFLTKYRIPHPGTVAAGFLFGMVMPPILDWVLGGNSEKLKRRSLISRLSDIVSDVACRISTPWVRRI